MAKDETTKIFTIKDGGVSVTVTAHQNTDGSVTFDFGSLSGATSLNLNALYWSDGDAKTGSDKLNTTGDNSLNMNGTKVAWDGSQLLSHTGLGNGENLILTATGDSANQSITLTAVNFASLHDLGIRATSVVGAATTSIKGVGLDFTNPDIPDNTPKDYFNPADTGNKDLSYATFYFNTQDGDVNGAGKNGHSPDGVFAVKVSLPGGQDLDNYYQNILDALVQGGQLAANTEILGVSVHAGNGSSETFFAYNAQADAFTSLGLLSVDNSVGATYHDELAGILPNGGFLVTNGYTDLQYDYGYLVHA